MYVDIDSAIKALKNCTNETDRQIASWLEELKVYKEKPEGWMWDEAEQQGYNKAIDDLIMFSKLHRKYANNTKDDCINFNDFIKFAEQLKAGGENGTGNQ